MVDEALPFQLTIRVDEVPGTEALQQVVAQNALALDGFEIDRYGGQPETGAGIAQVCTWIGAASLTAGAVKQLRRLLNEIAAAMTNIPREHVSIELNGHSVPISSLTDDMLTNLLAS